MPMRVAITAAAVRTALGDTAAEVSGAIAAGRSAVAPIRGFDASSFGDARAAQIWSEPETPEDDPALRILGPHGRLLHAVALEAHAAASLGQLDRELVGLFVGMGMVDSPVEDLAAAAQAARDDTGAFSLKSFFAGAYRQIHPLWPLSMLNNVAVGQIAIDLDIRGDNLVVASDADAGVRALLEAAWSVSEGTSQAALAVGVSGRVSPAQLARRALRPGPSQGVPGEGGAALVLEREEDARARGASILGFLLGGATSFGRDTGPTEAFRATLRMAGLPETEQGFQITLDREHVGDLGAGAPATSIGLLLADWARTRAHAESDAPRRALIHAAGAEGSIGTLLIEEAA